MGQSVSVDNDFARFGAKSYAINKINSVEVRERQPHGRGGAILCGIIAFLCFMVALGSLASPEGFSIGAVMFGGLFVALAYWQWQRAKIREYLLFLMTSSSETQAFVTRDWSEVEELRDRIEAAMIHHSRGGLAA